MGFRFNELPAGMEDMGPMADLKDNLKSILDSSGNKVSSMTKPPIEWIKDEELSAEQGKNFFYPKLETPLATEYGATRGHKMFYPMERELFLQLFVIHVSKYLFGVECMLIDEVEGGYDFSLNPKFQSLPVYQDSIND